MMFTRAFTITSSNTAKNIRPLLSKTRQSTGTKNNTIISTTPRFMTAGTGNPEDQTIVQICTQKIMKALETNDVKVTGAYDDPNGSHISIEVISSMFEGKRAVQRQQLVYKALWDELQGPVHAVDAMVCKTPDEK